MSRYISENGSLVAKPVHELVDNLVSDVKGGDCSKNNDFTIQGQMQIHKPIVARVNVVPWTKEQAMGSSRVVCDTELPEGSFDKEVAKGEYALIL